MPYLENNLSYRVGFVIILTEICTFLLVLVIKITFMLKTTSASKLIFSVNEPHRYALSVKPLAAKSVFSLFTSDFQSISLVRDTHWTKLNNIYQHTG